MAPQSVRTLMDAADATRVGIALCGLVLWARLFDKRNRIEFCARVCEVLAAATKRALPLAPLLERSRSEYRGARGRALDRLHGALVDGRTLADACRAAGRRFFPKDSVAVLEAASGTDALTEALRAVSVESERKLDLRHRGLIALAYPALLMLVMAGLMQINSELFTWLDWNEIELGGGSIMAMQTISQWTLGTMGSLATLWLLLGVWLPYPGKRLFQRERGLRAATASLRAGGGWRSAFPQFAAAIEQGTPAADALAPLRLPTDLQARLVAATSQPPDSAAEAIDSLANECARRATTRATAGLRYVQIALLLVIAMIAAAQFAGLFALEQSILNKVGPW